MRFPIGVLGFGLGYALLYYGVSMYRQYDPSTYTAVAAPPLSVLLGFPAKNSKPANVPFKAATS